MPYTDVEYQDLGLTPDEIAEMSDLGDALNSVHDLSALEGLAQLYLDAGLADEAERIMNSKNGTIDYVQNFVYENTGYAIAYNDMVGEWYYMAGQGEISGQFVGHVEVDRTIPLDMRQQQVIDEIGYNPNQP
jgi:hypothetical protein